MSHAAPEHFREKNKAGNPLQKKKTKRSALINDHRAEATLQAKRQAMIAASAPVQRMRARQAIIQTRAKANGLPPQLKAGVENLSGIAMDDVRVHYNSSKPAQLQAHAYAQGTDIHLAPGQEKHLAHEAWHVVQQKQGRVRPTMQLKGKVNINDDAGLEREADVMGERALQLRPDRSGSLGISLTGKAVVQAKPLQLSRSLPGEAGAVFQLMPNFEQWLREQDPPWVWDPDGQTLAASHIDTYIRNYFRQVIGAEPDFERAYKMHKEKFSMIRHLIAEAVEGNNFELVVSLMQNMAQLVESASGTADTESEAAAAADSHTNVKPAAAEGAASRKMVVQVPRIGQVDLLIPGEIHRIMEFEMDPHKLNLAVSLVEEVRRRHQEEEPLIRHRLHFGLNRLYSRLMIQCVKKLDSIPSSQVVQTCVVAIGHLHRLGYPCMMTRRDRAIFLGYFQLFERIIREGLPDDQRSRARILGALEPLTPVCNELIAGNVGHLGVFCREMKRLHEMCQPFREPAMPEQTVNQDRKTGYPTAISGGERSYGTPFPLGFHNNAAWTGFKNALVHLVGGRYRYITYIIFQGSAINGVSYKAKPGATTKEFDQGRVSDYDIALVSPLLHGAVAMSGANMISVVESERGDRERDTMVEETHTPPMHQTEMFGAGLAPLVIELQILVNRFNNLFNREVNFMVYATLGGARRHEGPSLVIDVSSGEVFLSGNIAYRGPSPSKQ